MDDSSLGKIANPTIKLTLGSIFHEKLLNLFVDGRPTLFFPYEALVMGAMR
jgi:hypothetical protein